MKNTQYQIAQTCWETLRDTAQTTMKDSFITALVMIILLTTFTPRAHGQASTTILPQISGSIRFLPELGILDAAHVGTAVQSTYFKTTNVNREFRRGFIEFAIPPIQGQILEAKLILRENRGTSSTPVPPDVHELSYYPADLIVNTDDFNRPTTFLVSFETDVNLSTETFSFDITSLITQFVGSSLGFRIKLAIDPTFNGFGGFGSGFGELGNNTSFPRIRVVTDVDPGTISGSVLVGPSGLANVTVKLLDNSGKLVIGVDDESTDANGQYSFDDLYPDDYRVMIVEPLGYFSDGNPKQTSLDPGGTNQVNFALTPVTVTNNGRGMGYWKHQFDVYIRNRGNAEESQLQLNQYISRVHQYYTPHFNVFSDVFSDPITTFSQWQAVLSAPNNATMLDKALQQLAALVMNFTSLKIGQGVVVTGDGRTAGDVLTYVSTLVTGGDASKYEQAKNLAEQVCTQQTIASGVVPAGNVLYKGGSRQQVNWNFDNVPAEFSLLQNYPNPFNPSTTIQFMLAEDRKATLKVFNILGQEVATLFDGEAQAGRVQHVKFDASQLPSGLYVAKLEAGKQQMMRKMMLLK
ncbi:MAG: hypothetical protein HW389_3432 [Bacteroidetes bacterium]|nr:hypothetical protein [Bacteroidota bacterium]